MVKIRPIRNSLVACTTVEALVLSSLQAPIATAQSSQVQDGTQSSETQSSVPDSVKPAEWLKQDVGGYADTYPGLLTADTEKSADGFEQAARVLIPVFVGAPAIVSVVELVMLGPPMPIYSPV